MARTSFLTPEEVVKDVQHNIAYFLPDERRRLGNADSAHGVMFGTMPDYGDVAVKPFVAYNRARREAEALEMVALLGFDALEPLRVARGGLAAYLITRRVPDLRHLGQLDWKVNIASPRLKSSITPTLNAVADTVAAWHGAGITHGDLQAKNVMHSPDGRAIYGDAEKTRINPPFERRTIRSNKDLGWFGSSALTKGLLEDRSDQYRVGYLSVEMLEPYFAAVDENDFAMDPRERQQVIANYWLDAIHGRVYRWSRHIDTPVR